MVSDGRPHEEDDDWAVVQLLSDPQRRAVFRLLRAAREPMTRDAVAAALGVTRPLAVFHLDRLADAGLLRVSYARPPGRGGPGAGRPAKQYEAVDVEVAADIPARRYELAARLFARALADAPTDETTLRAAELAEEEGRAIGCARPVKGRAGARRYLNAAATALDDLGYETERLDATHIRLRNCPFRAVAAESAETMCLINQRFVHGLLDGLGAATALRAAGDGTTPDCCVTVGPR